MKTKYSPQYYARLKSGSLNSAKAVVPALFDLIQPKSVVDVGCGTGTWLSEFKRQGVTDILGIDGSDVPIDQLEIEPREFVATDLTQPLRVRGQFDLALSLEVAEHLSPSLSDQFVEKLTTLAPIVLFSAAIPHQGGEQHLNEQWPAYWIERFTARGFTALDPFRRVLWDRADVEWWYAQNLLLFVRTDLASNLPRLANLIPLQETSIPAYIHPRNYLHHTWQHRVLRVAVDVATTTRAGDTIVLADQDCFGELYLPGRTVRPFVEYKGAYFGPPRNDSHAIEELQQMITQGADYFGLGWPAFWWLQYYKAFATYLEENHFTVLRNEQVIMYRLNWEGTSTLPKSAP